MCPQIEQSAVEYFGIQCEISKEIWKTIYKFLKGTNETQPSSLNEILTVGRQSPSIPFMIRNSVKKEIKTLKDKTMGGSKII
ncbi:8812_t:CDS:2, partial [Cetraspora pellucida]